MELSNMSIFESLLSKYGFNDFGARKSGNNPMAQEINNVSDVPSNRDYNQQNIINEESNLLQPQPRVQDNTWHAPMALPSAEDDAFGNPAKDTFQNPYSGETANMMNQQMDRLGIQGKDREQFLTNMHKFSQDTRGMESDNNPLAANPTSSAKGVYQFTDDSVQTGLNRMRTLGYGDRASAEAAGLSPYSEEFISGISSNPQEWSDEQADAMFLSNMMAQRGSDEYLMGIGQGEQGKARDAYYKFHHTAPDEATTKRAQNYFL
tara:strand:- start:43 stop:831 length:789 start_codon:yes stop_codon:yes gene_type:complete